MLVKDEKTQIIAEYATKENDTGSPEVQVAILTRRINTPTEHLQAPKHDHPAPPPPSQPPPRPPQGAQARPPLAPWPAADGGPPSPAPPLPASDRRDPLPLADRAPRVAALKPGRRSKEEGGEAAAALAV